MPSTFPRVSASSRPAKGSPCKPVELDRERSWHSVGSRGVAQLVGNFTSQHWRDLKLMSMTIQTLINNRRAAGARGRDARAICASLLLCLALAAPATAQESLCDNAFQDCRTPILQMIQKETVGIDVSFWFMTDTRYSQEIIKRWQAGVPVRVLLDLRADANYPANAQHSSVAHLRRHSDPPQDHDGHQPLEDDSLRRSGEDAFHRREFRQWLVLAGRALHELRRRGHLLHRRPGDRQQLHEEIRRSVDRYRPLSEPREHQHR